MRRMLMILVAALLVSSCGGVRRPPRDIMICPPPPLPPCAGMPYDASRDAPPVSGYKFFTYIVRGADSFTHEWAMAFVNDTSVLLTKELDKRGQMFEATWIQYDSVLKGRELRLPEAADMGPASSGPVSFMTMYAFGKPEADADIMIMQGATAMQPPGLKQDATWDAHPALSPDGRVLYFSSDRPGGYGGCDIWYTVRTNDGAWSVPENAGPNVNTTCDELTPFVSTDGKRLLFSSRGHATVGGYDIFRSEILSEPWTESSPISPSHFGPAVNLGTTVNTTSDELSPSTMTGEEELLYFSSNRRSRFDFDVYVRRRELQMQNKLVADAPVGTVSARAAVPEPFEIQGRVTDERQRGIANAEVSARDTEKDSVVARTVTDTGGAYMLRVQTERPLELVAQSSRGFFDVRRFDPSDTTRQQLVFMIPEVLDLRINFPLDEDRVPYDNVLDSNGAETDQRWTRAMDRIAENLKNFTGNLTTIHLVGHTDQNGTNAYNDALGKRRVKFVIDELVNRGLPATMFKARSAGEREPLARRPGEDDAAYDKRNRRVELAKVTK